MILCELFDRKAEWEVTREGTNQYEAKFNVGDYQIVFGAARNDPKSEWSIDFFQKSEHGIDFSMTGTGNEFLIMSTIKEIIQDFINRYQPTSFYFTADRNDPSRISTYAKMMKRYVPPQYRATMTQKPNADAVYRFIKESQQINELFDQSYDYQVTNQGANSWNAEFKTSDGNLIRFKANGFEDDWEVVFSGGTDNERTYDTTGSGDAFKVMTTIVEIMKTFVAQAKPKFVRFSGSYHSGHAKLYNRMFTTMDLPGYKKIARDSLNTADRLFTLERIA